MLLGQFFYAKIDVIIDVSERKNLGKSQKIREWQGKLKES